MKSTDSNATLLDMAQAINASLATDGSNASSAAVWGVFKPITTTGGTTAYSLSTGLSLTTLGTYQVFMVKWNATNTGASTLAVDGVAAAPLRKGAAAVIAGDLIAGNINTVAYDGTGFQVLEANVPLDPTLLTIAALTPTTDQAIYFTGTDTAATMSVTSFGRSLVASASAAAGRLTIGAMSPASRQTGDFNAAATYIYPVDTTSANVTATLPGSPAQGDRIVFFDAAGNWQINKLTIARNGNTIQGLAEDMDCTTRYAAFGLMFDSTRGWRIYQ